MVQDRGVVTERGRHWRQLIEECSRSGLTQAEFCRQRGIKGATLSWWKRQLRQRGALAGEDCPAKAADRFVEVRVPGPPAEPAYELVLRGGRSIRVPSRFDPQILSRLITAVESC